MSSSFRRDRGEPQPLLHHIDCRRNRPRRCPPRTDPSRAAPGRRGTGRGDGAARAGRSRPASPPRPEISVARIAHHAGHRRGLRQALLLHQQFERPIAAAAGRDLEHAGLGALGVEHRPDAEALQEPAPGDVLGQLLDRDAGLHAPDVGLAQHQLVEGDVARRRQGDLLNGSGHRDSLRDGRREPLSRLSTRHEDPLGPLYFYGVGQEPRFPGKDDG